MDEANGFVGTVVSGSGHTYSVNVLNAEPPATVSVNVMGLSDDETLDAGYQLLMVKIGSNYYATVPMWVSG